MSEALVPHPATAPASSSLERPKEIGTLRSILRIFRELRESITQAFSSLFAHKLRASLTVAGIAIGVGTVIAIAAVVAGFDQTFTKQLSALGPNTLYVSSRPWFSNGNNWWKFRNRPAVGRFDYRTLQARARLPEAIAPMTGTQGVVAFGERELKNIQIRGTVEAFLDTGGWAVKRGRFLSSMDDDLGSDACVIGADLEDAFFKGDDALNKQIRVGPFVRCTIVGTLVRKGNAFGQSQDALVVLPLSSFARSFGQRRGMTIAVVAPVGKVYETEEEIIQVMRTARRLAPDQDDNFSVNRQDKILQGFNQTTMAMRVVMGLIGIITLIVGGIGIMNILLVSVKERTREIGVRRALGARKMTILTQFLFEAIAVSFVGGVIGTLIGIGGAWFASQIAPISAAVSGEVIGLGLVFSIATGLFFGIWPAWGAAALHPIDALRYE